MKRQNLGFEVHLMRNWIWARWEWNECAVCKQEFRNEKYFAVFLPMYNLNFCMDCCPTKEAAEKAYINLQKRMRNARPPVPKTPPPRHQNNP